MRFFCLLVLALLAAFSVEARRNFEGRVDTGFRGNPCDKMCPKREGWDSCELVKKGRDTSVKCIDNRPDPPRGGPSFGKPQPFGRG